MDGKVRKIWHATPVVWLWVVGAVGSAWVS